MAHHYLYEDFLLHRNANQIIQPTKGIELFLLLLLVWCMSRTRVFSHSLAECVWSAHYIFFIRFAVSYDEFFIILFGTSGLIWPNIASVCVCVFVWMCVHLYKSLIKKSGEKRARVWINLCNCFIQSAQYQWALCISLPLVSFRLVTRFLLLLLLLFFSLSHNIYSLPRSE